MPAFELVHELWFTVFEFVHEGSLRSASSVMPLMLVCKTWKDIAEPLRFRSLRFHFPFSMTSEEIDALVSMLEAPSEMHTKVARWTRHILLDSGYIPEFSRIIRHAVNLRALESSAMLPPEFIEALVDTAGQTLQELNTVVGAGYFENELSRLRELRTLTLFIVFMIAAPNEVTLKVTNAQEIPVFILPRLELLTLEEGPGTGTDADSQILWLTWLSRCRFPKLRDICFSFERFPMHHAHFLIEFLNAHDRIHGLRFERRLVDPPNLLAVLPFVHVSHLSLSFPPSSPEFLEFLSPAVHELVIGLDVMVAPQCSHFWIILDSIAKKPVSHLGLRCLVFERPFEHAPGPLLWNHTEVTLLYSDDELDAYVSAVGRLVPHAFNLCKVGIHLLDEYGMDIASVQNQVATNRRTACRPFTIL